MLLFPRSLLNAQMMAILKAFLASIGQTKCRLVWSCTSGSSPFIPALQFIVSSFVVLLFYISSCRFVVLSFCQSILWLFYHLSFHPFISSFPHLQLSTPVISNFLLSCTLIQPDLFASLASLVTLHQMIHLFALNCPNFGFNIHHNCSFHLMFHLIFYLYSICILFYPLYSLFYPLSYLVSPPFLLHSTYLCISCRLKPACLPESCRPLRISY